MIIDANKTSLTSFGNLNNNVANRNNTNKNSNILSFSQYTKRFDTYETVWKDRRAFEPMVFLDGTTPKIRTDFGTIQKPSVIGLGEVEVQVQQRVYEMDYTLEDALNKNWRYSACKPSIENSFLYNATTDVNAVQGMTEEQFLQYVQENGLNKEIKWGHVAYHFDVTTQFEDFSGYTDYAGALYASLEQRINEDFSGEELEANMKTLNDIFNDSVNKMSNRYVDNLQRTFEPFGVDISADEMKQSISQIMEDKKEFYREYAKENTNYANLNGTKNEWAKRDVQYMAMALKGAVKSEVKSNTAFSEQDCIVLGAIANAYEYDATHLEEGLNSIYYDEESIGFAIGMNYLSANTLTTSFGASQQTQNIVESFMDKHTENIIGRADSVLAFERSWSKEQAELCPPLNKHDVYEVIDKVKSGLKDGKTSDEVFKETFAYAADVKKQNLSDDDKLNLKRYQRSAKYPQYDYFNRSDKITRLWNDFKTVVDSKDLSSLRYLYSSNTYYEGVMSHIYQDEIENSKYSINTNLI